MTKNLKLILALLLTFGIFLEAKISAQNPTAFYYMKLGAANPPCSSGAILPCLGLGARFQKGQYGCDISVNAATLVFDNYAALKGLFLYYPQPYGKKQIYFGLGSGVGYCMEAVPLGGSLGGHTNENGVINLEGVLGYEFRHSRYFATFIQFEIYQPTFYFGGEKRRWNYKPGIALMGGIGF